MAARVRRSIDRAEAMIEALLVLAISDQGAASRELLDLSAVAEDALELAAPAIARLGLTVEAELAPAETTGDQQLIERMVWNLVDNAVRHNQPGGWITIATGRVRAGRRPDASPTAAPWCPPTRCPRCPSRSGGSGGTGGGVGLGLSIARSVSAAHGAELEVRSQPEGGLSIRVVLPVSPPGEPDGLGGQLHRVLAQEAHRGRPVPERRAERRSTASSVHIPSGVPGAGTPPGPGADPSPRRRRRAPRTPPR